MLVFIDASGDPGRKIAQGSSQFFVLAVVMFGDHEQAARCEKAIAQLADELGRGPAEFKFSKDSHETRTKFLDVVAQYRFRYRAFVLDKDPGKLYGPGFDSKDSLYKWVCGTALKDVSEEWEAATVCWTGAARRRSSDNSRAT